MEFLKELLDEKLYGQVTEKLKGNDKIRLANVADGSYMPRAKFNEINEQVKDLESQIVDREEQLANLKKAAGDNDTLKSTIQELQDVNKQQRKESEDKLRKLRFDFAVEKSLGVAGTKNPKAVMALLDLNVVALKGDKLIGLDEQLEAVKASDGYLFEESSSTSVGSNPPSGGGSTNNPWSRDNINLTEQGRLIKNNPAKAVKLAAEAGVILNI
ncbi:MAG: phage scaffolding protein [Desulfobacterales bacterium]|nr:phage scaffolding protein [Desulfobacterales bacterium]